jgi:hypothetical protein
MDLLSRKSVFGPAAACCGLTLLLAAAAAWAADPPLSRSALMGLSQQPAVAAPVFQHCAGPIRFIAPNETFNLTCNVVTSLGGDKLFVLPEMWLPGNGCIATADKPRVIMVGNSMAVSATMVNRCGSAFKGSEGGLGWFIYQVQ